MIDAHCHLAFRGIVDSVVRVLADAKKSMKFVVTCGLPRDYEKTFEIAEKNEDFVFVSLGIHPEDVIEITDSDIEKNLEFIRSKSGKIVAVGEIGLDYFWVKDAAKNERCKKVFEKCLDIAEEFDLPVVLHSRKAEQDVFDIVSQRKFRSVVFHHYSGNMTLAKQIVDKGYFISLPTTTPRSNTLGKIGKTFPLQNLLTETDSPFNSPVKDEMNVPQNVEFTLGFLEKIRSQPKAEIEKIIDENAKQIFQT